MGCGQNCPVWLKVSARTRRGWRCAGLLKWRLALQAHAATVWRTQPARAVGERVYAQGAYVDHSLSSPFHELGHTFGLQHANTPGVEYGDSSSAMGGCCGNRCFNAPNVRSRTLDPPSLSWPPPPPTRPLALAIAQSFACLRDGRDFRPVRCCLCRSFRAQSWQVAWASPMDVLTGDSFPLGKWMPYEIPALALGSVNHVQARVVAGWEKKREKKTGRRLVWLWKTRGASRCVMPWPRARWKVLLGAVPPEAGQRVVGRRGGAQVVPSWTGLLIPTYFFSFRQPLGWDADMLPQYLGGCVRCAGPSLGTQRGQRNGPLTA